VVRAAVAAVVAVAVVAGAAVVAGEEVPRVVVAGDSRSSDCPPCALCM
jgi:hypothetical protein